MVLAVVWLVVGVATTTLTMVGAAPPGSCPSVCFCPLDARGRRQVVCAQGGLEDPLPVLDMPSDVEVLVVSAPRMRPNTLTLGPIFKGHESLEELEVTWSGVPALGAHSFWGLRRLRALNVSHNALTAVTDTNFRGAKELVTLDLSHNLLESVPSAVFRHLDKLAFLSLAHNHLPELSPRVFYELSNLHTLHLSHNPLGLLPSSLFDDTPNLHELRCAACGLQVVSGELMARLPQLRLLDLRHNRLTEVPPLMRAQQLTTLHLDGNHVGKLMRGGLTGPPMTTLTLAHNRLAKVESQAMANSSLTHLDLGYNRLPRLRLDAVSDGFHKLRWLRLSGNPLRLDNLMQVIPRTKQLRHLDLGELRLVQLPPDLLHHSRHLKKLNVSGNLLSEFPASALFATPHLNTLDLSHNAFRGLDNDLVNAFSAMASLEKVWLHGNPWQCRRCHVASMLDWLSSPSAAHHPHAQAMCLNLPDSPRCLRCAGPKELAGRHLQLLDEHKLPECENGAAWEGWLGTGLGERVRGEREGSHSVREDMDGEGGVLGVLGDHLGLVAGVGCGLVLALLLVVAAALLLARRHSALYYTHESDERHDSAQKLMSRNNNDNSPPGPRGPTPRAPTPRTLRATPVIATIEEAESIAGSSVDLQEGRELRAPRIVRLAASPLP